jgi:IS1 family transposase
MRMVTWVAIDADTKLVPSWFVGSRDADHVQAFISDLDDRMAGRIQLTSDGWRPYKEAVRDVFLDEVDYAQLVNHYAEDVRCELSRAEQFAERFCLRHSRMGDRLFHVRNMAEPLPMSSLWQALLLEPELEKIG